MNERIKELLEQAISDVDGIQNPDTQHMYIPDCFRDRFAELIVQECARVAIKKQTENDMDNIVSKNPAKDFAYALIEHFEIK
jgi:hypothetical protein